jgi:hypothetical protein
VTNKDKKYWNTTYKRKATADPRKRLWKLARDRAKKRGIPFNLEVEDILVPKKCPVLGIKLILFGRRNEAPSIDRIINTLGYIKGNIKVISMKANRMKGESTIRQMERILLYMKGKL